MERASIHGNILLDNDKPHAPIACQNNLREQEAQWEAPEVEERDHGKHKSGAACFNFSVVCYLYLLFT